MAENAAGSSNSSGDKLYGIFSCGVCNHIEYTKAAIKNHLRLHFCHPNEEKKGNFCLVVDSVLKMLRRHQRIMHGTVVEVCDNCGKDFTEEQKIALKTKLKQAQDLLCETCTKAKITSFNNLDTEDDKEQEDHDQEGLCK